MSTARLWPRVSAASISLRDSPTDRLAALPCGTICELVWTRPGADPRPGWKGVLDVRANCQAAPSPAQVAVWSVGNPADSRPGGDRGAVQPCIRIAGWRRGFLLAVPRV